MIECEQCGQVSDWIGPDSDWSPFRERPSGVRPLVTCEQCGYRQLVE